MNRIVITDKDVRQGCGDNLFAGERKQLPAWLLIILGVGVFVPPLLVPTVITCLALHRNKTVDFRYRSARACAWASVASWLFWIAVGSLFFHQRTGFMVPSVHLPELIRFDEKSALTSKDNMTAEDIARSRMPLVVVVHAADAMRSKANGVWHEAAGAGAIVAALEEGCLVLTSRHVVEGVASRAELNTFVGISLKNDQHAVASVVGIHKNLDLSLLWVRREYADFQYLQEIRPYGSIDVGELVYALGHPSGLEFTLSSGLVSQKRGDDVLQFSAPVSPGSSGGPIYDAGGRLLAIVQAVYDKTKNPNAENLNFGERVDDLRNQEKWVLSKIGRQALAAWRMSTQEEQASANHVDGKER